MNTRVSVIGTVGLPARYGGFETLVDHLARNLAGQFDITVYCSSKSYPKKTYHYRGVRLRYVSLPANGLGSIAYDLVSMVRALAHSDVFVILGVSGCLFLPWLRFFRPRLAVITNIDGLEWRRDKWSGPAKIFLRFSERMAVRHSDVVVADNQAIADHVRSAYGRPSRIIPYGGDGGSGLIPPRSQQGAYAFCVCRIEPENNVHLILEAFEASRLPLIIIGNWSASRYGSQLKKEYGGRPGFRLMDPIYDVQALDAIRAHAAVYIHGHSAGGTNPSLCEAMWLGLPVFCFDVVFNRYSTEGKARYFRTSEELSELVDTVGEQERRALGSAMSEIAGRRYRWDTVVAAYGRLIEETAQ